MLKTIMLRNVGEVQREYTVSMNKIPSKVFSCMTDALWQREREAV